jgi:hypothetical protein
MEIRIETLFDVKDTGAKESERKIHFYPPSTFLNINSYNKK